MVGVVSLIIIEMTSDKYTQLERDRCEIELELKKQIISFNETLCKTSQIRLSPKLLEHFNNYITISPHKDRFYIIGHTLDLIHLTEYSELLDMIFKFSKDHALEG